MSTVAAVPVTTITKVADEPLHLYAPAAVRDRLTNPAFTRLLRREKTLALAVAALEALDPAARDARSWHRLLDSHRAVRAKIAAYRQDTAALLPPTSLPVKALTLPTGVTRISDADSGTAEWLTKRQSTLGGSEVGAICKVGRWGHLDCEEVRGKHLDPAPADQEHDGLALVGDLWEPVLLGILGRVLRRQVLTDKATFADATRHASLDGYLLDDHAALDAVTEAKTASTPTDWADGVPAKHVLQVQHYTDLLGARRAYIVANVNDDRLMVFEVTPEATVAAGAKTPKKLGEQFSYAAVRDYAEGMVAKWNLDRARGQVESARRRFTADDAFVAAWTAARERGVVFMDTETSHQSATRGHLLELAAIRDDGRVLHRYFDVPQDHHAWNGTGMVEVHGITHVDVAGCTVLLEDDTAADEIDAFVGGRVVVAHNAPFERAWLVEAGLDFLYADSMRAFGTVVDDPAVRSNTMESLCAWAGVAYGGAHRALADVRMLAEAFEVLAPLVWAALDEAAEPVVAQAA